MKTLYQLPFFIFLFAVLSSSAQQNILYEEIQHAKKAGVDFVSLSSIFKQVPAKNDLQNLFIEPEEVRFLHYEETLFTDLREAIVLTIPLKKRGNPIRNSRGPYLFL